MVGSGTGVRTKYLPALCLGWLNHCPTEAGDRNLRVGGAVPIFRTQVENSVICHQFMINLLLNSENVT